MTRKRTMTWAWTWRKCLGDCRTRLPSSKPRCASIRIMWVRHLPPPSKFLALARGVAFTAELGVGGGQVEVRLGAGRREAHCGFELPDRARGVVGLPQHSTKGHVSGEIARRQLHRFLGVWPRGRRLIAFEVNVGQADQRRNMVRLQLERLADF